MKVFICIPNDQDHSAPVFAPVEDAFLVRTDTDPASDPSWWNGEAPEAAAKLLSAYGTSMEVLGELLGWKVSRDLDGNVVFNTGVK